MLAPTLTLAPLVVGADPVVAESIEIIGDLETLNWLSAAIGTLVAALAALVRAAAVRARFVGEDWVNRSRTCGGRMPTAKVSRRC